MSAVDGASFSGDDLPDGLVVADATGLVTVFNTAAERATGLAASAVLGRDVRTALPLQDTAGRRWWQVTDPWTGLRTRSGHRERLLALPGGREVLVTARYVRPGRNAPVDRVVMVLRDTDSRRRAETDHAGLISTVAHELRSPLTSVKGFTSTLLRRWDRFSDDQKRLMLTTVEADADRVTRLITELLDISRIDAGRLQVRKQPMDLGPLARTLAERAEVAGEAAGRVQVTVADDVPEVWADPDRVEQVFANLVENALRHGDGTVRVSVRRDPDPTPESLAPGDGPGVEVVVEDEGEGINEEHLGLVFTKFWRGSKRGGTGLGLYVVRGLVEAHDGRIAVGRSSHGGALFRFSLPVGVPDHMRD